MAKTVQAQACANIALVKYWGKRSSSPNLPAVGSISLTLDALQTSTQLRFDAFLDADAFLLDGAPASGKDTQKLTTFLDRFRRLADTKLRAAVTSENNFPTASGLASSSSGFAALAVAANAALGLELSGSELSIHAREGSGSAARSVYGGLVEMQMGADPSGDDAYAVPLHEPDFWDIAIVVLLTTRDKKAVPSRDGMELSRENSPYYQPWVDQQPQELLRAKELIANRDFATMGQLIERNALRMHAVALGSDPGVLYWSGATVDLLHELRALRADGGPQGFFTIDAGPHVKVFCRGDEAEALATHFRTHERVVDAIVCRPGPAASATITDEGA